MQNTPEREIDLMRLLLALWRRWWVILGCAALAALVALAITRYMITPLYRTSVSIYVDNTTSTEENENYISSSSLSTAQRLVKTYVTIVESDTVLEKVVEQGGLDLTAAQIRSMMSASSVNETEIFRIYITNADPALAAKIANAIADVAPDQISSFLSGSSTKVIDYAKVPTAAYSPNYRRNLMLGAVIGAAAAILVVCLATILDARVEDEEELERMFDRPVLGSIPAFDASAKTSSRYHSYNAYGAYGYGSRGTKEAPKQ